MSRRFVVALLALVLFPAASGADDAEDRAVAHFHRLGGKLIRDEGQKGRPVVSLGDLFFVGSLGKDDLRRLTHLPHLRSLDLHTHARPSEGLEHVGKLPRLRTLNLSATAFPTLRPLSEAKALEDLVLSTAAAADLRHLVGLPKLRRLRLGWTTFTDADLGVLAEMEHLEELSFLNKAPLGPGLEALGALKKLRSLAVNPSPITPEGFRHLGKLRTLQTLHLQGTPLGNDGLKQLAALTELRELGLGNTNVTDAGLAHLKEFRHLRKLDIQEATGVGLKHLAALPLEDLMLYGKAGPGVLKGLAGLKGLRRLSLSLEATAEAESALGALAGCAGLRELFLGYQLRGPGLKHLADLPNLEKLTLAGAEVDDEGFAAVGRLSRLRDLHFYPGTAHAAWGGPIEKSAQRLAGLTGLRRLQLHMSGLSEDGLRFLASLKSLEVLRISGGDWTAGKGFRHLAGLKSLRELHVGSASDDALKPLAALPNLERLELGTTKVTGPGLKHLVGLKKLTYLGLSQCPLGPEAVDGIVSLPSLRDLAVLNTRLRPIDLEVIRRALPQCRVVHFPLTRGKGRK